MLDKVNCNFPFITGRENIKSEGIFQDEIIDIEKKEVSDVMNILYRTYVVDVLFSL